VGKRTFIRGRTMARAAADGQSEEKLGTRKGPKVERVDPNALFDVRQPPKPAR